MPEPDFLLFASDATLLGLIGLGLIVLSFATWLGERRRHRRQVIDAVGCMPWTTLSVLAAFCGALLLAMAAMGWLRG
jgi:hypothetical protein